jgi:hypothetical protein
VTWITLLVVTRLPSAVNGQVSGNRARQKRKNH